MKKRIFKSCTSRGWVPCQDYSVHTLRLFKGLEGRVFFGGRSETQQSLKEPPFCIFENVDKSFKGPTKQRGRDFG